MVEIIPAYDYQAEVLALFSEYTKMLVDCDPSFAIYLTIQHYEDEIKDLNVKYGLPDGRLYLILVDGKAAGCIGLRKLDAVTCEMKRLYVRPEFRGQQLGSKLIATILADAKTIGYTTMLLDTLPCLTSAVHLYEQLGFEYTDCYNDSPVASTLFMKLDLTKI